LPEFVVAPYQVVAEAIPVELQALVEVWNRHGDSGDHPEDRALAHDLSLLGMLAARRPLGGRPTALFG